MLNTAEKLGILGDLRIYQRIITHPLGYILVPAALGLFASLGLAPFNSWPCLLAALILLFLILTVEFKKRAIFTACLSFYTAYHALSLWWLNFVMVDFGQLPLLLSSLIVILFGVYLALPYALFTLLAYKWGHKSTIAFNLSLLPLALVLSDFTATYLFTGFPWTLSGYSTVNGPLAAFAPFLGVKGIGFMLYIIAGAVCLTILRQFIYLPIAGIIIIAAVLLRGLTFTDPVDKTVPVSLIQGNIEQSVRWQKHMVGPTLQTYWELSKKALQEGRTVIWPESAIPLFTKDAMGVLSDLNLIAMVNNAHLVTGIQHIEFVDEKTRRAFNSIVVLGDLEKLEKPSDLPRYDKRHLVPFGEFVPFETVLRPLGRIFNFPMSGFSEGDASQPPLAAGELSLIPAICYESVFPELLTSMDEASVQGIIMLSNDSWFGPTRGPQQHLSIARMRCLELQKPMLRVTNSGITAILNADGTVEKLLPINEQGVLEADFRGAIGLTPYARFGDLPLLFLMLLCLFFGTRKIRVGQSPEEAALLRILRP